MLWRSFPPAQRLHYTLRNSTSNEPPRGRARLHQEVAPGSSPENFDAFIERAFAKGNGGTTPSDRKPLSEHMDQLKRDMEATTVRTQSDRPLPGLPAKRGADGVVLPDRKALVAEEIARMKRGYRPD